MLFYELFHGRVLKHIMNLNYLTHEAKWTGLELLLYRL